MLNQHRSDAPRRDTFWREAFTIYESVTPRVLPYVLTIGLLAVAVTWIAHWVETAYGEKFGLEIGFHEVGGAILTIALILRTNAGYERWWEARKLWGGIVNQCRNLAVSSLCYGPQDPQWREAVVRWTIAFPYACRSQLEGLPLPEAALSIVGPEAANQLAAADHMPSFVTKRLGKLLADACSRGMNSLAFAQIDRERAMLIDHIGGCERILKTPLPQVYSIKIRRILALFLLTLPFVLINRVTFDWLVPLITVMIAYPLISLDQIGHELQNPFSTRNLSHLPLGAISANIENNLLSLLASDQCEANCEKQPAS